MSWSQQLERASFRGVEFDCQTIDDEVGRRIAEHRYPYRSGAELEDMGREPRVTRLRAIFLGPDYEGGLGDLLRVVDEGKAGTFRHPLLGEWTARVRRAPLHFDPSLRDAATVELELVEDGTDTALPELFAVTTTEQDVEDVAVELEEELGEEDVAEVTDVVDDLRELASSARTALGQLEDLVNRVRNRVEKAIQAVKALGDLNSWPLVRSLKKAAYTAQKLGETIRAASPPLIKRRLGSAMPVSLLAHSMYGDAGRADEILQMNKVRNPFVVPAGTELRVYAR